MSRLLSVLEGDGLHHHFSKTESSDVLSQCMISSSEHYDDFVKRDECRHQTEYQTGSANDIIDHEVEPWMLVPHL